MSFCCYSKIGSIHNLPEEVTRPEPHPFKSFFFDVSNSWFTYAIILVSISEVFLVKYSVDNAALGFLRFIFGLALLGFFPGFVTVQIVFSKYRTRILDQIVLSIFLSMVISIGVGVALGTVYMFDPVNNIIILSSYTIVGGIVGFLMKFRALH